LLFGRGTPCARWMVDGRHLNEGMNSHFRVVGGRLILDDFFTRVGVTLSEGAEQQLVVRGQEVVIRSLRVDGLNGLSNGIEARVVEAGIFCGRRIKWSAESEFKVRGRGWQKISTKIRK